MSQSEASYESTPSVGDFQDSTHRGRDPRPRIITASHCMQVYTKFVRADAVRVKRVEESDSDALLKQGGFSKPPDMLQGMPSKLMRFDGAVETWLEQLCLPPGIARGTTEIMQYERVNDAARLGGMPEKLKSVLQDGNGLASIWYFNIDFLERIWPLFLQGETPGPMTWRRTLLDIGRNIETTHVRLGRVHCPVEKRGRARTQWLENLFAALQFPVWSPRGECSKMVHDRGLSHASMAIGDAVVIGTQIYVVARDGFLEIEDCEALLPVGCEELPGPEDGRFVDEPDEEDDEDEVELLEQPAKGSKKDKKDKKKGKQEKSKGGKGEGKNAAKGGKGGEDSKGGKKNKGGKGGKESKGEGASNKKRDGKGKGKDSYEDYDAEDDMPKKSEGKGKGKEKERFPGASDYNGGGNDSYYASGKAEGKGKGKGKDSKDAGASSKKNDGKSKGKGKDKDAPDEQADWPFGGVKEESKGKGKDSNKDGGYPKKGDGKGKGKGKGKEKGDSDKTYDGYEDYSGGGKNYREPKGQGKGKKNAKGGQQQWWEDEPKSSYGGDKYENWKYPRQQGGGQGKSSSSQYDDQSWWEENDYRKDRRGYKQQGNWDRQRNQY